MIRRRAKIFLGCEGDSERSYARWMQDRLDEVGLFVHLDTYIAGGGDPLAIVSNSARECCRRESLYGKYRKRAVLLDSDKIGEVPARDVQIPFVMKGNISLIYQEFDHESFLLRHFNGHANKRPGKKAGEKELKKVWNAYEKPADARQIAAVLDIGSLKRAMIVEADLHTFLTSIGFI